MSDSPTRVIIIEDHPMMRETLETRLVHHSDDISVVYSGSSVDEAIRWGNAEAVACIILDLDLGDGVSFSDNLERLSPLEIPILIVSASASAGTVQASLTRGVKGYVSKQSPTDEFLRAFDSVLADRLYVSTDLAAIIASNDGGRVSLSQQEQRALMLYSSGMKLDSVARRMDVSPATAKEYIRRVRSKYAAAGTPVPTKVELYRQAREDGLI